MPKPEKLEQPNVQVNEYFYKAEMFDHAVRKDKTYAGIVIATTGQRALEFVQEKFSGDGYKNVAITGLNRL